MNSAAEKSLVGQLLLGRYRVVRRIALGGMGAVYLARTEGARGFSKPVVIKRILPIWGGDEEIVSLFAREARILSQLQDPGIVSVIDFGQITDGTLVMVLDYVHGYHLAHWLAYLRAKQGHMPVEMALHIMIRVLAALQYAHTFVKPDGKPSAVIHRDVSPANILLDSSGNVKLVDFGIARAEGDDNYKTEAPQLRGKFGYLAPELFTGAAPSPQSDIYAAGVVLYELLSGENPFRGREVTDSYHKALTMAAPPIAGVRSDVADSLMAVVEGALAKEPAQRYASAAEFADALRRERSAPDEVCQARLRKAVQVAFAGPLAETLDVPTLTAAEDVWPGANAAEGVPADQSGQVPALTATPPSAAEPSSGRVALPLGTGESRVSIASDGRISQFPDALPSAAAGSSEHPTLHKLERRSDSDQPPPPSALRPSQLRLLSVFSMMLFGAILIAGILRSLSPKQDQVIVIEREPNHVVGAAPAIAGAAATNAAPPEQAEAMEAPSASRQPNIGSKPELQARSKAAAEGAASAGLGQKISADGSARPVEPDPKLLTWHFAVEEGRVQSCFANHAYASDTQAELSVEFQVSSEGKVERAELVPANAVSPDLRSCVLHVAKTTHFPRLTRAVTFRIPIQARVKKT